VGEQTIMATKVSFVCHPSKCIITFSGVQNLIQSLKVVVQPPSVSPICTGVQIFPLILLMLSPERSCFNSMPKVIVSIRIAGVSYKRIPLFMRRVIQFSALNAWS